MATAAATATPSSLLFHRPSPAAPKVAAAARLPTHAARISCMAVATPTPSSPATAATDRGVYNFASAQPPCHSPSSRRRRRSSSTTTAQA
ncbi:hypothetical protein E2562_016767 [Oryza meyeriana var. granulata]|uniref:Uncharacterized protein n=1 Tax=Oryza meyeriana var. granulata TaxID=110450 RepID=A0A6G1BLX9_9ORYZ|nr:hypothetical protein E2562_016767 [Oryza meyeriana var. granulata]